MRQPETRYTKVGDSSIAYQVMGEGPIDLVHALGRALATDGIAIRAGLHTGELELRDDGNVGGIAVHRQLYEVRRA